MWLDRLVQATDARIQAGTYAARPRRELTPIGSLRDAVQRAYPALVAEVKPGRPGQDPAPVNVTEQVRAYAAGGACAISVLTDPDHFGGRLENLELAREAGLPLLMKDFVIDPRQLEAARAWGATAVLAIVRLHDEKRAQFSLEDLVERAHELDLEVLAEVFTLDELDHALATDADLIGINVRDLDTLEMDPQRPAKLLQQRKVDRPVLHLSGIQSHQDLREALQAGANGVLVGSHLMAAKDPKQAVRHLLEDAA